MICWKSLTFPANPLNRKVFISFLDFFIMNEENSEQKIRIRLPRKGEIIGFVEQRVGGNRMIVKCTDGKVRNSRIPGRLRRALWIREGDYVIVLPWEFDNNKADVLFKYNKNSVNVLKRKVELW